MLHRADQVGSVTQDPSFEDENETVMNVFIGLAVATTCLSLVATAPLWVFLATAAKHLHNSMFHRVMRAPTRFFDTNPVGKLNSG